MPALRGILETSLYVNDLSRSAAFWGGIMQLRELHADDRFRAYATGQGGVLLLFLKSATGEALHLPEGVIPPHGGDGRLHLAFAIEAASVEEWESHLAAHEVAIEGRATWPGDGVSLYFRDPDGHLAELATPGLWPTGLRSRMKIAILDDYADTLRTLPCFAKLAGHDVTVWTDHMQDVDQLSQRLRDTDALVLIRERTAIGAELLERLPNLKFISQRSVYPHIDVAACTRLGIVLCSNMHVGTPSWATAELAWGLVISAARSIPQQAAALKVGHWQGAGVGSTLRGRTFGVWSYGRIGAAVAGYARAFGMRVLAHGGVASRARAQADGYEATVDRAEFFGESDVVSLHIRLTDTTRGIVGAGDLSKMKSSAILVNTSRAALIAPGALVAALRAGHPGRAAVDVYDAEPLLDPADPLLTLPNAICTPHIGYVTQEEYEVQFADIFDQIVAFAAGRPINVVNMAALGRR